TSADRTRISRMVGLVRLMAMSCPRPERSRNEKDSARAPLRRRRLRAQRGPGGANAIGVRHWTRLAPRLLTQRRQPRSRRGDPAAPTWSKKVTRLRQKNVWTTRARGNTVVADPFAG